MNNDRHVIAVFDSRLKADDAVNSLIYCGFSTEDLSLLVSDNGRSHHFEIDKSKSKTAEGIGYGAVLGGLAAGLGVAAAGIASVTIPGGIFISGPLAVSLAAGSAGAAAGGVAGGLIGIGIPEDEIKLVEKELKEGDILVAAHALNGSEENEVEKIFKNCGAVRVH